MSGTWAIALAAFLWSLGGVLIKLISADPVLITTLRAVSSGLALAPFIRIRQIPWNWRLPLLIFGYGSLSTCFVVSTKLTSAANAIALQSTAPLWVFLVTLAMTRRIEWRQAFPVGLIAVGLLAILSEPAAGTSTLGNLIALLSGILFAFNTRLLKQLGGENSIGLISICNLVAAPFIWLLVPDGVSLSQVSVMDGLIIALMGIVQLGIPYALYTIGLRRTTTQKATMVALIEPTFNPIWVFLFVGEIPTVYGLVGGLLILSGLLADALANPASQNSRDLAGA